MDPNSIPPPPAAPTLLPMPAAVPFQPEPNNHPPSDAPPQTPHPPYAEMIYTAIEALKEKDGSSKHAIGKYIEQVYKEQLPSTHPTLLTHHLKRLKSNGMLVMNKKSYMIPRSAAAPTPNVTAPPVSSSPKPRGRPRKVQVQAQAQAQAQVIPQVLPAESANVPQQQQNAEPVWAALGLEDEPVAVPVEGAATGVRRTPGRPRKSEVRRPGMVQTPGRRGRPPGSKSKKRVGRPPKPQTEHVPLEASAGTKRRPGRPPKNQPQATPIPFAAPAHVAPEIPAPAVPASEIPVPEAVPGGDVTSIVSPRRRGRPKKNATDAVSVAPAAHATGFGRGSGRGRGRGRGAGGRGRGRGRGGGISMSPTGRSVGRPRKGTTTASTSQSGVANEDLKRKLEYFQAKIQESLAALKPHFNHESPVTSIAAIQELEVLGTMDLNAPLRDETLPPQQQQQPPPQELPVQQQQPLQQQMVPPQQHAPAQQLAPQPQMYPQQFPQFHMQY